MCVCVCLQNHESRGAAAEHALTTEEGAVPVLISAAGGGGGGAASYQPCRHVAPHGPSREAAVTYTPGLVKQPINKV